MICYVIKLIQHVNSTHKLAVGVGSWRQDVFVDEREVGVIENGVVGADVDKQCCKYTVS